MDIAPIDTLAIPIFLPLAGFSAITAPQIQIETKQIKEGNWYYTKKVVTHANTNTLTLQRGIRFYDSDFYRWISSALAGDPKAAKLLGLGSFIKVGGPTYRRTMVLLHFFPRVTTENAAVQGAILGAEIGLIASATGAISAAEALNLAITHPVSNLAVQAITGAKAQLSLGPVDQVVRIPARAYLLHGCIPTRYKVGSDFDASSADISIAELDLDYEMLEEINLSS